MTNVSLTKKILMSVLGLGVVGSLVGMGTFASFTATATNTNNTFTTGTLNYETRQGGSAVTTNVISLSAMKPGDSKSMFLEVKNTGSLTMQSQTLATTAPTSSLLNTDTTDGLHLTITRCSVAWGGTATTPTCGDAGGGTGGGTTETNFNNVAIVKAASSIGTATLAGGASNYYLIAVNLPTSAGNTFQGLTSNITFTWAGAQQAGSAS